MTLLARAFAEYLRSRGIAKLYLGQVKRYTESMLQSAAVAVNLGVAGLCYERRLGEAVNEEMGIAILRGRGGEEADAAVDRGCEPARVETGPPYIVVDFALWGEMTGEERREAVEQFVLMIGEVRRFLWDGNVYVRNAPAEFHELLSRVAPGMRTAFRTGMPGGRAILLDPYGEVDADEQLIRSAEVFVIGGIVDKGRRLRGATRRLAEIAGLADLPRARIALRGSIIGVPDRINTIARIVLEVAAGKSLEEAIIEAMSNADRVRRLTVELARAARGQGVVSREVAEELARWLRADERLLRIAARRARVELA